MQNLKPYDVRIVAEGEDESIDKFVEEIKITKFPITVESTELRFEKFKGKFKYFEIKRGNWKEDARETGPNHQQYQKWRRELKCVNYSDQKPDRASQR